MAENRRILVIANETCAGAAVIDEVRYRAAGPDAEVLVVAPASGASRMGHWLSSHTEEAREAASRRVEDSVAALRAAGLQARGDVGDPDPLQALDDAYRVFSPDEVIISTHPPAHSTWLERKIVQRARDRYPEPVTHVVVDLEHEAALTHHDPRPFPQAPKPMLTLYRPAGYEEALSAQTSGFRNVRGVHGDRSGVLFTDSAVQATGPNDLTVFLVEIPEELAAPYEIPAEDETRRFVLPAELVNRHRPRALAADWAE